MLCRLLPLLQGQLLARPQKLRPRQLLLRLLRLCLRVLHRQAR